MLHFDIDVVSVQENTLPERPAKAGFASGQGGDDAHLMLERRLAAGHLAPDFAFNEDVL
mgnify:CR=1 FL=1